MESLEIRGLDEIRRKLERLPVSVQKKVVRKGLRAGCKPIQKEARANAPVLQSPHKGRIKGLLKRAIRIVSGGRKGAKSGTLMMFVMMGQKWFVGEAFYGAWQEFGHFTGKRLKGRWKGEGAKERYRKASLAAGRKFIPGKHFIEKAYESKKNEAVNQATRVILEGIEEEVNS